MIWLIIIFLIAGILFWIYRFHIHSFLIFLSVKFEHRPKDFQLLSSLRESLVHERKKKIAGLEMILSSWERGDEIQPKSEYFEELLGQLKELVHEERRNLMMVTKDIFLWGKLWKMLRRIEKKDRKEKREWRNELKHIQDLLDQVVDKATELFSFTLNQVVAESVKIVRVEKSQVRNIAIQENLDDVGNTIRFSYDKFKEWQRILTNLIRNAVDAVEMKQSREGVVSRFIEKGEQSYWVRISTFLSISDPNSISICIEDSGIGMDETTRTSFYKKGFTLGKEGGLGLGVSEESVQLITQYGNWQVESQKGAGTKITINMDKEKAQKAELILPPKKPFLRTKLAWGLSFLLLALVGLGLLFTFNKYSRFWVDWNPAYAVVDQARQVVVYNSKGKKVWVHGFDRNVSVGKGPLGEREHPLIKVENLDSDKWNEILVVIDDDSQHTGQLFCLDYMGNVKWVFYAGQNFNENTGIQTNNTIPEKFHIREFLIDSFKDTPSKEILVYCQHFALFPCQLAMLDHKGNVIGEYWHPGIIFYSSYADLDSDGRKKLICAGINNRLDWRPIIFILNLKELTGKIQGPPYTIFSDIKPAKENKYVVLPQIKNIDWTWVEVSPKGAVQGMTIEPEDIYLVLFDGRHYSLSKNLEYRSCEFRVAKFLLWRQEINFPFEIDLKSDSLNWKNFEVYEKGVKVK
jgi:signal transduction histidine kinase